MYRMLTIFMFCLAATWSVSAQTAPVPDKYEIETAADCARYNDDVLRCAEWLRTTPYDAVIEVYRANRGTLGKIREVETMIKRRQKER